MKSVAVLAFVLLAAAPSLRAGSPPAETPAPHCAFADERFLTIMNVCVFAAGHYLAQHRWPQHRAELRAQALRLNTRRQTDEFFARFSRLDLQPQGRDLRLDIRFRLSGQVHRQSIVLHPGKSVDAMLQAASEPPAA